jgi:hypothetical protein
MFNTNKIACLTLFANADLTQTVKKPLIIHPNDQQLFVFPHKISYLDDSGHSHSIVAGGFPEIS